MNPGQFATRPLAQARRGVLWTIAAVLLAGCSAIASRPHAEPQAGAAAEAAVWQRVRFHIHWNRSEPPRWHVDALLAHRIAAPLVDRERQSIALWRFHRRAADDAAGHSLSLLTYATPAVNARICRSLSDDSLAAALRHAEVLQRIECEGFAPDREGLIEATSDPRWSAPLQRAWPHYIMGVSELWLHLIDEHARKPGIQAPASDLDETLAVYQRANDAVTATWQREGHHALLHHLNALFGYQPIDVGAKEWRRF